MKILVLNSGSSSIKCQYFIDQKSIASVSVERIGEGESKSQINYHGNKASYTSFVPDHHEALNTILSLLKKSNILTSINELNAVGHRVVHGGEAFKEPTLVNEKVIQTIKSLIPLAPLHNPANLEGIEVLYNRYPNLPQVAVFDTAFHQSMPQHAYLYPIPYELSQSSSIRRYGFHGTSHAYVAKEAAKILNKDLNEVNLITLHLGNGASVTAIQEGQSIDTSMGMTPLEGLMMGTRSGDIDPAIIPYLAQNNEMDIESIDKMLNKESGLKGICGTNDMREVIEHTEQHDKLSTLALKMYTYRIKKYIGAYTVALGHVDAIIFTGGIGEHAGKVREMVCKGLYESIGVDIDTEKNNISSSECLELQSEKSRIKLFVIPTNEELEIVLQTETLLSAKASA
jgi:acetate kinase